MSDGSYDLMFRGECLPDTDPEQVSANLGKLLKLDAEQLAQLFSGRTTVIRRGADRQYAARFQQAFKQAGARLRVVPVGVEPDEAAPPARDTTAASTPTTSLATTRVSAPTAPLRLPPTSPSLANAPARKLTLAERLAADAARVAPAGSVLVDGSVAWQKPVVPVPPEGSTFGSRTAANTPRKTSAVTSDTADRETADSAHAPEPAAADGPFQLAPLGADMLTTDERARAAPAAVIVDISALEVAPAGGNLPTLQPANAHVPSPPIPDLTISPPGVDLGEPQEFVELALDLSHLSLAALGAQIGPEREAVIADIDISMLSLAPSGTPLLA